MERTAPKQIVLIFLLALGLYGFMLPIWIRIDTLWGRGVAAGASTIGMPLTGIQGDVRLKSARSVQFEYFLSDPRTGGTARVPQRLLNLPDVPLGIALSLSLLGLGWRRRLLLAAGTTTLLYIIHVALLTMSAHRAAALLAQTSLSGEDLNERLAAAMNSMNQYGDLSVVAVVVLTAIGWFLLRGRPMVAPV
ncbi:MAG: hypothetical protein SGI90_08165 [Candidatus Eisenbacteria bacterium]|nr:hypothetical protein [Candidatus Eisenbacteria bacterium]